MQNTVIQLTIILTVSLLSFLGCKSHSSSETTNGSDSVEKLVDGIADSIWEVYQDRNGHYWFGSNGAGVYRYDGEDIWQITTEEGLVSNMVRGIQEDNAGNLLIETPEGVSKINGQEISTVPVIRSLENEWRSEPNDLWLNCNGNLMDLYRYDGEYLYELQLPRQDLLGQIGPRSQVGFYSPYTVFGISKDSEGNIWFGTQSAGAFRFDGTDFIWIADPELSVLPDGRVPGVRSILQDREGYFWLSHFHYRYRIDPEQPNGFTRVEGINPLHPLLTGMIPFFNSGLTDTAGNLWMTTYGGGVWKYDGETLTNLPIMDGDQEALLVSIYQDNQGVLWLGTDNAGVFRQKGQSFEKFEL